MLTLELAGRARNASGCVDAGGRVVLTNISNLKVGQKSMATVSQTVESSLNAKICGVGEQRRIVAPWAVETPTAEPTANGKDQAVIDARKMRRQAKLQRKLAARAAEQQQQSANPIEQNSTSNRHQYVLTFNRATPLVWQTIIATHGVEWLGFQNIQRTFLELHSHAGGFSPNQARVISAELWDNQTGELVSGEIGVVVGSCYVCLSLFANKDKFPRCNHVRAQAVMLTLSRAGVQMFDVGTTANYFCDLYGFTKTTRVEFINLWRENRARELGDSKILEESIGGIWQLLASHRSTGPGGSTVAMDAQTSDTGNQRKRRKLNKI
eukprot:c13303_g1_i1.p1 GENE.c13303_g1_i1~~c13303_g1_i1.p1  ORF type:complete len:324 (-),score=63.71 c13303_g1_i1:295-1266(-)